MYLEGSDQYQVGSTLLLQLQLLQERVSPYKFLLSHGFVMDGEGKK